MGTLLTPVIVPPELRDMLGSGGAPTIDHAYGGVPPVAAKLNEYCCPMVALVMVVVVICGGVLELIVSATD